MLNNNLFKEVGNKISETLANSPAKDLEKNAKAMFGGVLSKMDLVTREEFDIQQQILLKTREQLVALEARLAALEGTNSVQTTETETAETADGNAEQAAE